MNYGQPYFIEDFTQKQKIIDGMWNESKKLEDETKITQK